MLETGNSIHGTYCGQSFSGVIVSDRLNTLKAEWQEVSVKLNEPISVYGDPREELLITFNMKTGKIIGGVGEIK